MKICMISPEFPPEIWGGAGKCAYDIANGLSKTGFETHVISARTKNSETYEKIENVIIHRYDMNLNPPFTHFSSSAVVKKAVNNLDYNENFDIFHGFYGHYFLHNKKPLISTALHTFSQLDHSRNLNFLGIKKYYSHCYYGILSHLEKHILERSSRIIAISDSTKNALHHDYGIELEAIDKIYIGIDLQTFKPIRKEVARDHLNLPHNKEIIICVSALSSPRKRAIDAIRSLTYIKEFFPNVLLLLVGKDNCGLTPLLKSEVIKLHLHNNVMFTGRVSDSDLLMYYAASDAFVLPSLFEGQGIAPLEAMAMKIPVVVTNNSSLTEIVTHKKTGLLISPISPQEIAESIILLLSNQYLKNKIISDAFDQVSKRFDINNTIQNIIKVYEEVNV